MSELITLHPEYAEWIRNVGANFKQCQIKAASKVNEEMLRFYWNLGRDIVLIVNYAEYGSKFFQNLSYDLRKELPDVKSFSVTNLKYMKYFYEMYCRDVNCQQVVDDSVAKINQQPVDDFIDERIFHIPWGHHIQILGKCKGNQEKALFFVYRTIENNWSRSVLMNFLDTNLYERQGKAIRAC